MRNFINIIQKLTEGIKDSPQFIENPNSSGQGFHPEHDRHPFHDVLVNHQYKYSHSTPIRARDGYVIHHTYKDLDNRDNNIGIYRGQWEAGRGGEARKTIGQTPEQLARYLKGRRSRDTRRLRAADAAL